MLSQGVEDYKTKDFDFASQVKYTFMCVSVVFSYIIKTKKPINDIKQYGNNICDIIKKV